jgi:hypothetical protein
MTPLKLWFECKVQYNNALGKRISEVYLIDAFSFGEAEHIASKEAQTQTEDNAYIVSVKRAKIAEVFENAQAEAWYKAKVNFIMLDQEKGTEKRVPSFMLIQADDIESARTLLVESLKDTMSGYEVAKIEDTPIVSVIKFEEEPEA